MELKLWLAVYYRGKLAKWLAIRNNNQVWRPINRERTIIYFFISCQTFDIRSNRLLLISNMAERKGTIGRQGLRSFF